MLWRKFVYWRIMNMLFAIKFVLVMIVLIGSSFLGYLLANRYKSRVNELSDFLVALDIFETKIKYTYDSLTTTFLYIADNMKTKIYRIFYITAEEIKNNKNDSAGESFKKTIDGEKIFLNLTKEDIEVVKSLGVSLGQTDLEGQLKNIELVRTSVKKQLEDARNEKNKNYKLYRNMGVLSGLIIIIIIL